MNYTLCVWIEHYGNSNPFTFMPYFIRKNQILRALFIQKILMHSDHNFAVAIFLKSIISSSDF